MIRLVCFAIGYLLGLFQSAFIIGKLNGIDIREHGSGNAGTTNALRVLGTKIGLLVFAGDLLKAILSIVIVRVFIAPMYPDLKYLLIYYAAFGCILAHDFPFYMNFKGGKGIAVTAGMILSYHPAFIVMGVITFFGPFLITHYVSLGSLLMYGCFFIQTLIFGILGIFGNLSTGNLMEIYILAALMTGLAYWQHRANIVRLLKHEESKTYLGKKKEAAAE